MKIAILVPSGDIWQADFGLSLAGLMRHCAITPAPNGEAIETRIFNVRMSVLHAARNYLFNQALKWCADWCWTIDSDMRFPPDTIHRLLARGKQFVGGYGVARQRQIVGNPRPGDGNSHSAERVWQKFGAVHALKFGCVLVSAEALRKLPRPRINFGGNPDCDDIEGLISTDSRCQFEYEDQWFSRQLKAVGVIPYLDMELSAQIRHCGMVWRTVSAGVEIPSLLHTV